MPKFITRFLMILALCFTSQAALADPDRDPFMKRLQAAEQRLETLSTQMGGSVPTFAGDSDRDPFMRITVAKKAASDIMTSMKVESDFFSIDPDRNPFMRMSRTDPLIGLVELEMMLDDLEKGMKK